MERKPTRFEIRLPPDLGDAIDAWRRTQPDIPPRAEAARRLIEVGLEAGANAAKIGQQESEPSLRDLYRDMEAEWRAKYGEALDGLNDRSPEEAADEFALTLSLAIERVIDDLEHVESPHAEAIIERARALQPKIERPPRQRRARRARTNS